MEKERTIRVFVEIVRYFINENETNEQSGVCVLRYIKLYVHIYIYIYICKNKK